jgi:hypothetical protein
MRRRPWGIGQLLHQHVHHRDSSVLTHKPTRQYVEMVATEVLSEAQALPIRCTLTQTERSKTGRGQALNGGCLLSVLADLSNAQAQKVSLRNVKRDNLYFYLIVAAGMNNVWRRARRRHRQQC